MLLSQMFRKASITQLSVFKPACEECQKYRTLILNAKDTGNKAFGDLMRSDFEAHCNKEHSRASHT